MRSSREHAADRHSRAIQMRVPAGIDHPADTRSRDAVVHIHGSKVRKRPFESLISRVPDREENLLLRRLTDRLFEPHRHNCVSILLPAALRLQLPPVKHWFA